MPKGKAHFSTMAYFSAAWQNWMNEPPHFCGLQKNCVKREMRADPYSKQNLVEITGLSTSASTLLLCWTQKHIVKVLQVLSQMDVTKGK